MKTSNEVIQVIKTDPILNTVFKLGNILGEGAFGIVFEALNCVNHKTVALKIELNFQGKKCFVLEKQYKILMRLSGCTNIVKPYSFAKWTYGYYMELQRHGQNLYDWIKRKNSISKQQLEILTLQLLNVAKSIHAEDIIHRDIKPENFVFNSNRQLVLIDFGMATKLSFNLQDKKTSTFIGNINFCSKRAHQLKNQSQKDDLQSIFYVVAFLWHKKLPWFKLFTSKKDRFLAFLQSKQKWRQKIFFDIGQNFSRAFYYIINMEHAELPKYDYLMEMFQFYDKNSNKSSNSSNRSSHQSNQQKYTKKRSSNQSKQELFKQTKLINLRIKPKKHSNLENNQKRRSSFFFQAVEKLGEQYQDKVCDQSFQSCSDISSSQLQSRKNLSLYCLNVHQKNPFRQS